MATYSNYNPALNLADVARYNIYNSVRYNYNVDLLVKIFSDENKHQENSTIDLSDLTNESHFHIKSFLQGLPFVFLGKAKDAFVRPRLGT